MEKKQIALKIICIIILIGIIAFFIIFYGHSNKKTEAETGGQNDEIVVPNPSENKPSVPKQNYSTFPRYSAKFLTNSKIINIGGRNNEKLLKDFVINDEIYVIVETNSDSLDFKAKNKSIAICMLDSNLTLLKAKILDETENKSYLDCVIFNDGFVILVKCENCSELLYYDSDFKLQDKLTIDRIDCAKLVTCGAYLKLLSYSENTICFRVINTDLYITSFCKINSYIKNFYGNVISLVNKDIFVSEKDNSFDVFEVGLKTDNNQTYYVINHICTFNYSLCNIIVSKEENSKLIISAKKDNKPVVITIDMINNLTTEYELNLATDNYQIVPLDKGYLLHNFMDNSLAVLDSNFNIILNNILQNKPNIKVNKTFYNFANNNYMFFANKVEKETTTLYTFKDNFLLEEIVELPKINDNINVKKVKDITYIFVTTNNNIDAFSSCFGGYDIFIIKLNENIVKS